MGSRKGLEKIDPNYKQVQQAFRPNMSRQADKDSSVTNYTFKAPAHIQVPLDGRAKFSMDLSKQPKHGDTNKKK